MPVTNFANLLLIVYAVCELVTARRLDPSRRHADATEQVTTMMLMVAYVVGVLAINTDYLARESLPAAVAWVGLGIGAVGCGLRLWALQTLGRAYARTLVPVPGRALCTNGPYRIIRHPGYLGDVLIWTGATLSARNGIAVVAVAALVAGACDVRIRAEEAMLDARFGEAYRRYRARSWRLVPGLY